MPELPDHLEQLLRRQGVTEEQLDELRRTGRVASLGAGDTIDIDGITISSAGNLTPEALAQLRRMHRFMPKGTVERLEMTTGADIDGDGIVGLAPTSAAPREHDSAQHMATHRAEAAANPSGPFVTSSPMRSVVLPITVVILGAGAVIAWLAAR